jgi:hypothetical protein
MRRLKYSLVLICGIALFGAGDIARAANQTVTSTIKFFSDIVITQVTPPNFGYVRAATVATCVLDPVTSAVTGCASEGGTPTAGSYTIAGSSTQLINISAGGYTAQGASTPSAASCAYNGGAAVPGCSISGAAAPGAGKNLKVGLSVATTAAATDGTTNTPSFTLTVVYQ